MVYFIGTLNLRVNQTVALPTKTTDTGLTTQVRSIFPISLSNRKATRFASLRGWELESVVSTHWQGLLLNYACALTRCSRCVGRLVGNVEPLQEFESEADITPTEPSSMGIPYRAWGGGRAAGPCGCPKTSLRGIMGHWGRSHPLPRGGSSTPIWWFNWSSGGCCRARAPRGQRAAPSCFFDWRLGSSWTLRWRLYESPPRGRCRRGRADARLWCGPYLKVAARRRF